VGSLGFEPRLPTPQAGILDQARLRPLQTVQRHNHCEGKINNTLLKLKSLRKADKTVEFTSDRLRYLSKFVDLDDSHVVCVFIANKKCEETCKNSFVKALSSAR
jgi:hypothetical protein